MRGPKEDRIQEAIEDGTLEEGGDAFEDDDWGDDDEWLPGVGGIIDSENM